jgi:hypothetical protein
VPHAITNPKRKAPRLSEALRFVLIPPSRWQPAHYFKEVLACFRYPHPSV